MKNRQSFFPLLWLVTLLFAFGYQSLHVFWHEEVTLEPSFFSINKHKTVVSEKEDCPVCDFKFASFLSPEVLHFDFIPSFYEIPYQFNSNVSCITFEGNSFYLRGPPTLV